MIAVLGVLGVLCIATAVCFYVLDKKIEETRSVLSVLVFRTLANDEKFIKFSEELIGKENFERMKSEILGEKA